MKIMFWNVRGLGKSYRRSLVRNHIISENLEMVALQETIKQDFEDWELKELAGSQDFSWFWTPSKGHSGGMIMGVKTQNLEVEESVFEHFFMGILVRNRTTNYRFWVINVYGPAQHKFLADFIQEISSFCSNIALPILMGGDFNLIRNNKERN
jgi:exonuclease III